MSDVVYIAGSEKIPNKKGYSQDFTNLTVPAQTEVILGNVCIEDGSEFSVGLNAQGLTRINLLELRVHYLSKSGGSPNQRFTANSVFMESININSYLFYTGWHDVKGYITEVMMKNNSSSALTFNTVTLTVRQSGNERKEYCGYSTDAKPDISVVSKGATFFEIDTDLVYINDGTKWVVF